MSTPQSHAPQRASRDLGALTAPAMSMRESRPDWLLSGRQREDEARTGADVASATVAEPEDDGLAFLRRLREAGL